MEKSTDPDVDYSLTTTFSAIEVNIAIWAGSVPALWPLIRGRSLGDHISTTARYPRRGEGCNASRRSLGWIRTVEVSRVARRGADEADLELTDVDSTNVRKECKASFTGDSDEEGLAVEHGRNSPGEADCGRIRRAIEVEVTVSHDKS